MDAQEIIAFISNAKKVTPVKAYIKGKELKKSDFSHFAEVYHGSDFVIICDEYALLDTFIAEHGEYHLSRIELDRRNSAVPLVDYTKINARIEPGVFIRDRVSIGNNCVIMMGAVINIGAEIGVNTMIDMNVVVGGRVSIGAGCHIGAGSVLAGVIEPPSATPVVIEDGVVMGANAVVLEGVRIGKNSVVGAGAVVINDVPPNSVVAGVPAKVIKIVDEKTKGKTTIVDALRSL
ncbi:2,3,4,5-tetrahydropyridine-2,6-dicarboxylate N-acetyltransferase [bacterium]|nr:2,3,4,5-tetrahydropyridine-2,6-dicarboxylate N-acetyltransferase [bacterium]